MLTALRCYLQHEYCKFKRSAIARDVVASRVKKTKAVDAAIVMVRLPEALKVRLVAMAEANGRSMTAEAVAAIEQHLAKPDRLDAVEAFIKKYHEDIHAIDILWQAAENLEYGLMDVEEQVFGQPRSERPLTNPPGLPRTRTE